MIYSRQLKFYRTFKDQLQQNSSRYNVFFTLLNEQTDFLHHYKPISEQYGDEKRIQESERAEIIQTVNEKVMKQKYKFVITRNLIRDLNSQISPCLTLIYLPVFS